MTHTNPLQKGLLALVLLGAGCGQVVTPDYRGEPLATVSGQLTAETNVPLPETVRLAVAWYPAWLSEGATSAPKAIVTQEVTYRGAFPQRYTFDFFAPPPAGALVASPPQEPIAGRAAMGFLLAYEDLNGNGQLDTIHSDGTGGDRILGSSWDWHLDGTPAAGTPTGYAIFYLETSPGNDAQLAKDGLRRGYNLIGIDTPVPLDTPIPIALTAQPTLALHICEEAFSGQSPEPCGIVIPQPQEPPPEEGPHFGGKLEIIDGAPSLSAYVFDDEGQQITNATIFAGSTPVPYDEVQQQYRLANAPITPGGTLRMRAQIGNVERSYDVTMPGDFTITSPAAGAQVKAGSSFTATWTASTLANYYSVELDTGDFMSTVHQLFHDTSGLVELDSQWTGAATFRVSATHNSDGNFANGFEAAVTHTLAVSLVP